MKHMQRFRFLLVSSCLSSLLPTVMAQSVEASIDAGKTSAPISKYVYGQFVEHIGNIVNSGLWSEMLDDRKFYFPISSKEPDAPAAQGGGPFRNMQLRKWRPVGPDEVIVMDKDQPFVGDQSPEIKLYSATPQGIRQVGLALVKGKKYVGRIYLRGTPGSKVKVSLSTHDSGGITRKDVSMARQITAAAD